MGLRSQLLLLQKLQKRKKKQKGFTLVELMIVVAVVGILGALALPRYLSARNAAAAGAAIGEQIGLAKECATFVISGIGTAPDGCTAAGGNFVANWGGASVDNLNCLDRRGVTLTTATISVAGDGTLACQ